MIMILGAPSRSLSLEENLKIFKEIGYNGWQLDLCFFVNKLDERLKKCFLLDSQDDEHIKKVKYLSEKVQFPVLAMHTFFPISENKNLIIKNFEKHLKYLQILKCKYLILHISGYSNNQTKLQNAINILKEVKTIYEQKGCEILLENDHDQSLFITTTDIKQVTSQIKLNLCFDTSHAMQSDVNLDEFWNEFKDKIKAIHLSDFKDGKAHKEIGTGILKQFKCYKEIINSNKLLILEVGKDFKRAKSKEQSIKVWENSFLEVKNN